jgi:uncharacterized protein (DUF305 family)
MKIRSLTALALVGAFALAACGDDSDSSSTSSASTTALDQATNDTTTPGATFNDADVTFAQGMIPHHEQAIEMADIALDPNVAADDNVKEIATRIQGAQDPEIELMKGWLASWGQPEMGDTADHDMSSMTGMMSAEDMDMLASLTGSEFDTMWMQMMIEHHEGAIAMAEEVKTAGQNTDVALLADQIIAAQTAEIAEMKGLLGG